MDWGKDASSGRDLVVEHYRRLVVDIPNDRVDDDLGIANALFIADRDRYAEEASKVRRVLRPAKVGRDHDGVGEVPVSEVACQYVKRVQMVDRHSEEPVDLRGM